MSTLAHRTAFVASLLATSLAASLAPSEAVADPPARATGPSSASRQVPDECGQDPFDVDYGPLRAGSLVRLGRHRSVDGNANWDPAMEHYVGRVTPVVSARGLDPQGCPIIEVAVDSGEYVWRVRDVSIVAEAAEPADGRVPELSAAPGFVPDPRVHEGRLSPLTRRSTALKEGCAGWVGARPTFTLLLQDDFPTFSLMAHAGVDLVLVVRTPTGELVCVDDVEGHDPVLTGRAVAGRYEVYVGAYEASPSEPRFRVALSERATVRVASIDAIPQADVQPLDAARAPTSGTHLQSGRPTTPGAAPTRSPRRSGDGTQPSSNTR